METQNLIFKNWKCRDSKLGLIMTNLPVPFSDKKLNDLKNLIKEKRQGLNANGNKVKWSENKQELLDKLFKERKEQDVLPVGAKTFLDETFNEVFWGRKDILTNKYLDKGTRQERDVLDLISRSENYRYRKNDEFLEDEYTCGTFDSENPELEELLDTKANYSKKTFDNAEMDTLYKYQIKSYCIKRGYKKGWLVYGLVNSPRHHISNERVRVLYAMGNPDSDDPEWIKTCQKIELNHVYDFARFAKDNPNYDFENKNWEDGRYDIPEAFRIKKFFVSVEENDADDIARRVMLSRIYLCEKEREIRDKAESLGIKLPV